MLAFVTFALAAFLLAPTVASVHDAVTDLEIDRDLPWQIWKWTHEPEPWVSFPDCNRVNRQLESEVTQWPDRIEKDEAFTLRGIVVSKEDNGLGVATIEVDLFLNETKEEPGTFLGKTETGPGGYFTLVTSVPVDLQAARYHLVAHAKQRQIDCRFYFEHWSDPEMDVVSRTVIEWSPADNIIVGRETTVTGRLLDAVGTPLSEADVKVSIDGDVETVETDANGQFSIPFTPKTAGKLPVVGDYRGDRYYIGTRNETTIEVAPEGFELDGADDGVRFQRGAETTLTGRVLVAEERREHDVRLRFEPFGVAECAKCPAKSEILVPVDAEGRFTASFVVPSTEDPVTGRVSFDQGGLVRTYPYNASVDVATSLHLVARGEGLFTREYSARAQLLDEAERPVAGRLALWGPDGWREEQANASGIVAIQGSAPCGSMPIRAYHNGTDHLSPSYAEADAAVCGFLALIPWWLLAIPLWVWPIVLIAPFLAWRIVRRVRERYASTIAHGPPVALAFIEPADDALGYASVGERVVAVASLEGPLPDGHHLRMGSIEQMEEHPLDAELRAHLRYLPGKLGDVTFRAEIVDPRGRVVTRRTLTLHVVRYAEEIEARYLKLRTASGAHESATPREFEAWLRARAPDLEPAVARRLVRLFEEADYSPRVAGRGEFVAYLAAERGVPEVSPRARA